jgi:hypothetical protein
VSRATRLLFHSVLAVRWQGRPDAKGRPAACYSLLQSSWSHIHIAEQLRWQRASPGQSTAWKRSPAMVLVTTRPRSMAPPNSKTAAICMQASKGAVSIAQCRQGTVCRHRLQLAQQGCLDIWQVPALQQATRATPCVVQGN